MRFIMVKTPDITEYNGSIRPGESVAVNVGNISSIKKVNRQRIGRKEKSEEDVRFAKMSR